MRIKEKFINSYAIVNCILIVSSQIFNNVEDTIWLVICVLSAIGLAISLKEDKKAKASTKIFGGITFIILIGSIIYKVYKGIL